MQGLRGNMKFVFLGVILMAFNANAADAPKADDKKKPERSAVPERIPRPKATPDSLPQHVEKNSNPDACPKFEYKEKPQAPKNPSLQRNDCQLAKPTKTF